MLKHAANHFLTVYNFPSGDRLTIEFQNNMQKMIIHDKGVQGVVLQLILVKGKSRK